MYVVLEEIEEDVARLVPDSRKAPLFVPIAKLPIPYTIGDVFLVEYNQDAEMYLKRDLHEKERRLNESQAKRKRLLNIKDRKKPNKRD